MTKSVVAGSLGVLAHGRAGSAGIVLSVWGIVRTNGALFWCHCCLSWCGGSLGNVQIPGTCSSGCLCLRDGAGIDMCRIFKGGLPHNSEGCRSVGAKSLVGCLQLWMIRAHVWVRVHSGHVVIWWERSADSCLIL